jgi:hypothetical protein
VAQRFAHQVEVKKISPWLELMKKLCKFFYCHSMGRSFSAGAETAVQIADI